MTYDLSSIMTHAWKTFRFEHTCKAGSKRSFSECLKRAWRMHKIGIQNAARQAAMPAPVQRVIDELENDAVVMRLRAQLHYLEAAESNYNFDAASAVRNEIFERKEELRAKA